jgi:aminoglycoside phosphotransferase (APT) family kinase protein
MARKEQPQRSQESHAVSHDLGPPIASGNEAELFAWGDRVLKLSKRQGDPSQAELEARTLAALAPIGLAPAVGDVIEINGRWGVVMERIDRPVLGSALADPATLPMMLDLMVTLHRRIHALPAPDGLPDLQARLAGRIGRADRLGASRRDALIERLRELPAGDRLCHGDFHPFNILGMDEDARVIDWLDATRGPPAADVCRTYVLASAYDRGLAEAYVEAYLAASGLERTAVEAWLPIVAAARLVENVPDEFDRLAELAQGAPLG